MFVGIFNRGKLKKQQKQTVNLISGTGMTEAFWPVFTSLGLSGCSSLVDDTQTQVKGKFSFSESTKC